MATEKYYIKHIEFIEIEKHKLDEYNVSELYTLCYSGHEFYPFYDELMFTMNNGFTPCNINKWFEKITKLKESKFYKKTISYEETTNYEYKYSNFYLSSSNKTEIDDKIICNIEHHENYFISVWSDYKKTDDGKFLSGINESYGLYVSNNDVQYEHSDTCEDKTRHKKYVLLLRSEYDEYKKKYVITKKNPDSNKIDLDLMFTDDLNIFDGVTE
jgi:hypothetical protein